MGSGGGEISRPEGISEIINALLKSDNAICQGALQKGSRANRQLLDVKGPVFAQRPLRRYVQPNSAHVGGEGVAPKSELQGERARKWGFSGNLKIPDN